MLSFLARKPDSGLGNIRSSPGSPGRNVDWVLLAVQGILAAAGCLIVYSASRNQIVGDPYAYVTRQVVFTIVSYVVMGAVMSVDYDWFKERAAFLYGVTIVLLTLLLLMGLAQKGDRIAFDFGRVSFQPAELGKFTVLVFLAVYLAEVRSEEVTYPRFLGGLIMVGVPTALIVVQPDLGSASVLVSVAMGVLLVAGAKSRYIALVSVMALFTVVAAFLGGLVDRYQKERLRVFLDQDTTDAQLQDAVYQVRNAVRAVGTGGLWGKGWLQGQLTNGGDVPVMWADFPFAAVGEQFGLAGCAALLTCFAVALMRIWRIAALSRDLLGTYLCAGVFTIMLWQTFQNIGMTLGIMPVTGLPLPFISYGGSSIITHFAMFGLVQSVHMRRMR